jgi:hypothetical protein
LAGSSKKEEEGRRPGAAGIEAARERTEQRKGKGRKEEEGAPTGGVPMSAAAGIKEKRRGRRAAAGRRRWAARPLGTKGKKVSYTFFLFLFQTFSNSNFSFQIQTKILQTFSQNFINFLNFTQATKNYAKPNNDAQTLDVSKLIKLN